MRDGLRVLDADAHVIEPAGPVRRRRARRRRRHRPPADDADGPVRRPRGPRRLPRRRLLGARVPALHGPRGHRRGRALPVDRVVRAVPAVALGARSRRDACRGVQRVDRRVLRDRLRAGSPAIALVPTADVALAAAEAEHAATLGLPGVMVRPNPLYGRDLGDRAYDPLYDVLEEHDLTLSVHEGLGVLGPTIGRDRTETFALRHAMSHPMEQMAAMGSLMLARRARAAPDLRVAFLESGTGWLPYWLARLDGHAEWMADTETARPHAHAVGVLRPPVRDLHRPRRPARGLGRVAEVGADHVMWASTSRIPTRCTPRRSTSFLARVGRARAATADDSRRCCGTTPVCAGYGWTGRSGPGLEPAQVAEHRGGRLRRPLLLGEVAAVRDHDLLEVRHPLLHARRSSPA